MDYQNVVDISNKIHALNHEINETWKITTDLGVLLKMFDRGATDDEKMNVIIGLICLYDERFEGLTDDINKLHSDFINLNKVD